MQLYSIKGGDKIELENKQYNIGISLGNKWFTVENIVEQVKWSLKYTREHVIVYVADSIHAINLEVRNNISHEKALIKANAMGDDILENVRIALKDTLGESDFRKIVYSKWEQITYEVYKDHVQYLKSLFENENDFRERIRSIVIDFTQKENRKFSDIKINRLCDYIIEEMPELINRVSMNGVVCDAYAYPYTGELVTFIDQIQRGEVFSNIKEKIMYTKAKVFLEVR